MLYRADNAISHSAYLTNSPYYKKKTEKEKRGDGARSELKLGNTPPTDYSILLALRSF